MALFGFIVGFITLTFLTVAMFLIYCVQKGLCGISTADLISYLFVTSLVIIGWYLLFTNAPFTIAIT